MTRSIPHALLSLSVVLVLAAGCRPTCERTCRNLLKCDLDSQLVLQDECELSCNQQEALYVRNDNRELELAYRDHRRCLIQSTCDEINDGVCYDADLFPFDNGESSNDESSNE